MKKTAIIDIGSNSVRYMITEDLFAVHNKELSSTILGEGLHTSGILSIHAIERTVRAVCTFVDKAKEQGAQQIYIFATEAVRAATNGKDFTHAVKAACGIDVDVISGDTEAQIGFMGCGLNDCTCAVIDIGGASAEIVVGKNEHILYKKSLPLGMVRLLDAAGHDTLKVRENILSTLVHYGTVPLSEHVVGIGGTATSIGAMALGLKVYDSIKVHLTAVSMAQMHALLQELNALKENGIPVTKKITTAFPILSENRARVIENGIIMMIEILQYLKKESFIVSEKDNMEGYILYKKIN